MEKKVEIIEAMDMAPKMAPDCWMLKPWVVLKTSGMEEKVM